jgi:hypothetical protein
MDEKNIDEDEEQRMTTINKKKIIMDEQSTTQDVEQQIPALKKKKNITMDE